ncbi:MULTISPECIES: roadblock/LC7 domain-containing protein [Deinococcus]|uniref:Roadblock/LC7 domain-containing protein n=1 Tax=Deinococcus multiflagellatus TaxID=1656887 RepID=A0ABW1ZF29_9DEIO|nr:MULTISPECIES: roadblock/LC7 domain-containing protein [Deinococcus]MBZ9712853.1 roadblock/LC7 domain-containing protein [Deinococcus multiflagellatus]
MLDHLSQLVKDVDGAWAAAIAGLDGLLIEGHSTTDTDLSLLVAEHAGLFRVARSAYDMTLGGGQTRELYVRGERLAVYLHPVKTDYFLLLAIDGRSNLGQARLYGRDAARKLEATL